jgi:hypothetical protein
MTLGESAGDGIIYPSPPRSSQAPYKATGEWDPGSRCAACDAFAVTSLILKAVSLPLKHRLGGGAADSPRLRLRMCLAYRCSLIRRGRGRRVHRRSSAEHVKPRWVGRRHLYAMQALQVRGMKGAMNPQATFSWSTVDGGLSRFPSRRRAPEGCYCDDGQRLVRFSDACVRSQWFEMFEARTR